MRFPTHKDPVLVISHVKNAPFVAYSQLLHDWTEVIDGLNVIKRRKKNEMISEVGKITHQFLRLINDILFKFSAKAR